jgi:hypothetical protein
MGETEIDRSTAFRLNCVFPCQYLMKQLAVDFIDVFFLKNEIEMKDNQE